MGIENPMMKNQGLRRIGRVPKSSRHVWYIAANSTITAKMKNTSSISQGCRPPTFNAATNAPNRVFIRYIDSGGEIAHVVAASVGCPLDYGAPDSFEMVYAVLVEQRRNKRREYVPVEGRVEFVGEYAADNFEIS